MERAGREDVAFIGLTLEGTPLIVTPAGVEGLEFRDEVVTTNALVDKLRREGIDTIVVLIHEGGQQTAPFANGLWTSTAATTSTPRRSTRRRPTASP